MKTLLKKLLGNQRINRIKEFLGHGSQRIPQSVMDAAAKTYRNYMEQGRLPSAHPRIIHLETRSLCNSRCGFCAAAITNPERPKDALMPDETIDKVLAELMAIGYANRLSFYNNNEPFLDKRIFQIVARARQQLPRAYLEIKTNGLIVTADHVFRIFEAGLDQLFINDYVADGQPSKQVLALQKELSRLEGEGKVIKGRFVSDRVAISTRQVNEVLSTRAGTAPNRVTLPEPLQLACFRPFEMMTINPAGNVGVCSSDLYFRNPMGNVNKQSLMEIWNSPKWQEIRWRLLDGDRAAYPETCRSCDTHNPKIELMQAAGVSLPRPLVARLRRVLTGKEVPLPFGGDSE